MKNIAIDVMGGDNNLNNIIEGSINALKIIKDIKITLIGSEKIINNYLKNIDVYYKNRIDIINSFDDINNNDHPMKAINNKKNSSLVIGLNMLKNDKVDAFISSGNSGALLIGSHVIVGRIKNISRISFAAIIPTIKGKTLLLDAGANVDANEKELLQYAILGSAYMKNYFNIKNPKVGLLNIGIEREKGNMLVKKTIPLLEKCESINFCGSFESRDIVITDFDVIVTDAFAGNVLLKTFEGVGKTLLNIMKSAFTSSIISKICFLYLKNKLKILKKFNYSEYGGAILLGCKKLVIKMHGIAKSKETTKAILQCKKLLDKNFINDINNIKL